MSCALAEGYLGGKDTAASAALKVVPSEPGPQLDERSFVLSLIKHQGEPVLDVGTGDCACLASRLAIQGTQVVALDMDRGTTRAARGFLKTHHLKKHVRVLRDDITASRLPPDSFRNIVCFNVLHHVSQLDSALGELRRILASDGRLVISDFDEKRDGFPRRLKKAANRHFRSVTPYRRPMGRWVLCCEK